MLIGITPIIGWLIHSVLRVIFLNADGNSLPASRHGATAICFKKMVFSVVSLAKKIACKSFMMSLFFKIKERVV